VDLPGEVTGRVPDRQWKIGYYNQMKNTWCTQAKSNKQDYVTKIAREDCTDGMVMRAGDSVNYAIGQGDTLVTPIQEAVIYSALSNGGTLYQPNIGKAIVSADGKSVHEIQPKPVGRLPDSPSTIAYIDQALQGVITEGTAAWKFGGWPQNKIPLQAKTGTAEVYGKQTTGWLATYSKDYAVIMTIAQAGTGSGATGQAVRTIYSALYGVQPDGSIDPKKAILPHPPQNLPKIGPDGVVQQASFSFPRNFAYPTGPGPAMSGGVMPAALPPDRNEKLLFGRRYHV
jgi:penicillin-binding protein 2